MGDFLLVVGDEQHHGHAGQQCQELQQGLGRARIPEDFGEHGDGAQVDEAAGGEGKDPGHGGGAGTFGQERAGGAGQSGHGGQELQQHGLKGIGWILGLLGKKSRLKWSKISPKSSLKSQGIVLKFNPKFSLKFRGIVSKSTSKSCGIALKFSLKSCGIAPKSSLKSRGIDLKFSTKIP